MARCRMLLSGVVALWSMIMGGTSSLPDCVAISDVLLHEKRVSQAKEAVKQHLSETCLARTLNCAVWLKHFDPIYDLLKKTNGMAHIYLKGNGWVYTGESNESGPDLIMRKENQTNFLSLQMSNGFTLRFQVKTFSKIYEGLTYHATRYPFNNDGDGFDFSGNGRGCNQETAQVDIINYTNDSFSLKFKQCCECDVKSNTNLNGTISWTSNVTAEDFCGYVEKSIHPVSHTTASSTLSSGLPSTTSKNTHPVSVTKASSTASPSAFTTGSALRSTSRTPSTSVGTQPRPSIEMLMDALTRPDVWPSIPSSSARMTVSISFLSLMMSMM